MGVQINYFGGEHALEAIREKLSAAFGPLAALPETFAKGLQPVVFETLSDADLLRESSIVLFPTERLNDLDFGPSYDGRLRVDLHASPAMQLSPAKINPESDSAKVGRLFLATADHQMRAAFRRFCAKVRRLAKPFTYGHRYWVFPDAEGCGEFRFSLGRPISNPLQSISVEAALSADSLVALHTAAPDELREQEKHENPGALN